MYIPCGFAHGSILRARRVGGLLLAETKYAPRMRLDRHAHEHARFTLVLTGAFDERRPRGDAACPRSTLLFRQRSEPHAADISQAGATCLIVDLDDRWLDRVSADAVVLDESADFRGGLLVHLAQRLHGEFLLRDEVSRLAIESLVLGMLAEASRRAERSASRVAPRWLEQARDLLHARFSESLTLADIAGIVGVHPVHLARSFRACYDCTVADYVRQLRLDYVCREMAASSAPLSDIALGADFYDQSHLSRLFKNRVGMTPAEYRLRCRRP